MEENTNIMDLSPNHWLQDLGRQFVALDALPDKMKISRQECLNTISKQGITHYYDYDTDVIWVDLEELTQIIKR